MKVLVKKFLLAEGGVEMVEYAIVAGLIIIGAIATMGSIGAWTLGKYTAMNEALQGR